MINVHSKADKRSDKNSFFAENAAFETNPSQLMTGRTKLLKTSAYHCYVNNVYPIKFGKFAI